MTEEKQKDQLFSETLQFKGYDFKKSGKTEAGKEWSVFSLRFESGQQYPWTVDAWGSIKGGPIPALVPGNWYEIVYKEEPYTHPQYGPKISKKAILLKPSDASKSTQGKDRRAAPAARTDRTPDKWVEFRDAYLKQTEGTKRSWTHMLGAYINATAADEFKSLITLCKKEVMPKSEGQA